MNGTTARQHRKVPVRFTATMAPHSSAVTCSIGLPTWPSTPPATLTRMSTAPSAATISSTTVRTWSSRVTSSRRDRQRPPRRWHASAVAAASSASTSTAQTDAPRRTSSTQIERPMPWAAPVTSAARPSKPQPDLQLIDPPSRLLHRHLPQTGHLLIGLPVGPSVAAVAQLLPDRPGRQGAQSVDVGHRLSALGGLGHAVPGEVLEPGGVRGHGVDGLRRPPGLGCAPPVVHHHSDLGVIGHPF